MPGAGKYSIRSWNSVSHCLRNLRTYVLWDRNRILLVAILFTSFVSSQLTHNTQASGKCIIQTFLVASFSIVLATSVPAAYATSAIPGITGCYRSSTSFQYFIAFLLLSVFELGLMVLTLIRAVQNWRINQSRLYVVLVNHNISYYVCGFLLSVTNIFASLLLQDSYQTFFYKYVPPHPPVNNTQNVHPHIVSSSSCLQFLPRACTSISGR